MGTTSRGLTYPDRGEPMRLGRQHLQSNAQTINDQLDVMDAYVRLPGPRGVPGPTGPQGVPGPTGLPGTVTNLGDFTAQVQSGPLGDVLRGLFTTLPASADRAVMNAEAAAEVARIRALFRPTTGLFLRATVPTANRTQTTLAQAASAGVTTVFAAGQIMPGRYNLAGAAVTVTGCTATPGGVPGPWTVTLAAALGAAAASGAALVTAERDYQLVYSLPGTNRQIVHTLEWLTNNPPAYSWGLNQLHNLYSTAPMLSVGIRDAGVVRSQATTAWSGENTRAEAYGGVYRYTIVAGTTATYTTPAGVTDVAWRGVTAGSNGGLAKVTIDGDPTLATACPTAQQLVTSGLYPATILTTGGGSLAPTDRVLDCSTPDPVTYNVIRSLATGLPAAAHTVVLTATGYGRVTGAANGRMYLSGFAYGSPTMAATDTGAELVPVWLQDSASVSSAWEYADQLRPAGAGTSTFVGNVHGYEEQVSLTIAVGLAATPTAPTLVDGALTAVGTGTRIVRTSRLYHPDAGATVLADVVTTYTLDRLGLQVRSDYTPRVPLEVLLAYGMLPLNGAFSTTGERFNRAGLLTLPGTLTFTGATDARYGSSQSAAAWLWGTSSRHAVLFWAPDVYGFTAGWGRSAVNPCSVQDRAGQLSKVYLSAVGDRGAAVVWPAGVTRTRVARYLVGYFPGGAEAALANA